MSMWSHNVQIGYTQLAWLVGITASTHASWNARWRLLTTLLIGGDRINRTWENDLLHAAKESSGLAVNCQEVVSRTQ